MTPAQEKSWQRAIRHCDSFPMAFAAHVPHEVILAVEADRAALLEALRNLERTAGIAAMADDPVRVAARKVIKRVEKQT